MFDTGARYSCVKAEYSCLGKILRRSDTIFSTPNGTFFSNKESKIKFNFTECSESKIIAWKFHVLPRKQKLPYDVIIGHDLMKDFQMGVFYSRDVILWDSVRLPMQKIQNRKWTGLNLIDQEDSEAIKTNPYGSVKYFIPITKRLIWNKTLIN